MQYFLHAHDDNPDRGNHTTYIFISVTPQNLSIINALEIIARAQCVLDSEFSIHTSIDIDKNILYSEEFVEKFVHIISLSAKNSVSCKVRESINITFDLGIVDQYKDVAALEQLCGHFDDPRYTDIVNINVEEILLMDTHNCINLFFILRIKLNLLYYFLS